MPNVLRIFRKVVAAFKGATLNDPETSILILLDGGQLEPTLEEDHVIL